MKITSTLAETRAACRELRAGGRFTLGLVPTMGALHQGHLSLVRAARQSCDAVAVSIFVNPLQFGPGEDLDRYPRTLEQDTQLLVAEGVDVLFTPTAAEMYPPRAILTMVDPGEIGDRLDGLSRPGHFRGVATVVSKLFHIVEPDCSFFGQKDAAQVAVLRAMVRDLNMPVDVLVQPTVREKDGLALSSRNRYLSAPERQTALALSQALFCAERAVQQGERDAKKLMERMRRHLDQPGIRVDYVEVVDADTLLPVQAIQFNTLLAVAAWVGQTRLIDNVLIGEMAQGAL